MRLVLTFLRRPADTRFAPPPASNESCGNDFEGYMEGKIKFAGCESRPLLSSSPAAIIQLFANFNSGGILPI
jgi:hypothetical protein